MMESCQNVCYQSVSIYKYLQSLQFMFTEKKDFALLLKKADTLQKVLDVCSSLYKINVVQHFNNEALELCQKSLKIMDIAMLLSDLELPNELQMCLNRTLIVIMDLLQNLYKIEKIESPGEHSDLLNCVESILFVLTQLKNLKVVPVKDYDALLNKVEVSTKVTNLLEHLESISTAKTLLRNSEKEYRDLLNKLKDTNSVLQCPVYGEVIFDEHRCTPV